MFTLINARHVQEDRYIANNLTDVSEIITLEFAIRKHQCTITRPMHVKNALKTLDTTNIFMNAIPSNDQIRCDDNVSEYK